MNKKVSIILPVYNGEKCIKKCIDSIINQTYKNLEIIAINDGSTDNTLKELQKYKDERIIIIDKKNKGVSNSRNIGINKATGYYTTFIDADDWIDNNFIEIMVKKIEAEKVDCIRCNFSIEKENKSINQDLYDLSNKKYNKNEFIEEKVLDHFLLLYKPITNYVMLLLAKTEIIKKISFNETLYMMEDVLFYQELFNSINNIYFLDECLYHYEENNQSATRDIKKVKKNILGIIASTKEIEKYLKDNNISISIESLHTKGIDLIIKFINKLFDIKEYDKAKRILIEIYNDKYFKQMLFNSNLKELSLYRRIFTNLYRKNNINEIIFISKFRNIIKSLNSR